MKTQVINAVHMDFESKKLVIRDIHPKTQQLSRRRAFVENVWLQNAAFAVDRAKYALSKTTGIDRQFAEVRGTLMNVAPETSEPRVPVRLDPTVCADFHLDDGRVVTKARYVRLYMHDAKPYMEAIL